MPIALTLRRRLIFALLIPVLLPGQATSVRDKITMSVRQYRSLTVGVPGQAWLIL